MYDTNKATNDAIRCKYGGRRCRPVGKKEERQTKQGGVSVSCRVVLRVALQHEMISNSISSLPAVFEGASHHWFVL